MISVKAPESSAHFPIARGNDFLLSSVRREMNSGAFGALEERSVARPEQEHYAYRVGSAMSASAKPLRRK